jgi:hypothetical protein
MAGGTKCESHTKTLRAMFTRHDIRGWSPLCRAQLQRLPAELVGGRSQPDLLVSESYSTDARALQAHAMLGRSFSRGQRRTRSSHPACDRTTGLLPRGSRAARIQIRPRSRLRLVGTGADRTIEHIGHHRLCCGPAAGAAAPRRRTVTVSPFVRVKLRAFHSPERSKNAESVSQS